MINYDVEIKTRSEAHPQGAQSLLRAFLLPDAKR